MARASRTPYLLSFPVLFARLSSPPRHPAVRPLLAVALAAALGGCSFFRAVTGVGLQRPSLTYESWSAEQLDADGVTIALHYRLENPNDFSLDLRRLEYRLEIEGRQVAEGELPAGMELRGQDATPVSFPVRLRWRDVPGLVEVLLTRSEVAYRVSGTVGIGSALGTVALPFEHRDRVALPRLPTIRIEAVHVREASLGNLALDLRLRIDNGNPFPLPVGALTYGLRVGGEDVLAGASHPLVAVPPRGHAVVSVPIRLSLASAASAIRELLQGAAVQLRGIAGFGDLQVPVDDRAEVGGQAPR